MTAQDLKNSILQLAMQGKLVPQDPNDEPASELLKRIKAEKVRLIKEGKIRKEKSQPPISENEIPFDIPESWGWSRLSDISYLVGTKENQILASEVKLKGRIPAVSQGQRLIDGYCDHVDKTINNLPIILFGDHTRNVKYIDFPFVVSADGTKLLKAIRIDSFYLYYWIMQSSEQIRNRGYARHFSLLKNNPIPIPPIKEQKRIVAKIEELLPLIERYDESEKRLLELNKKFPDELRKSILQQAVQGKLTEQDPHDEPASELLKRIKAEKARLIKEGKIRKEKPLPPISDDEIPFDIPEGWEWVKLNEVARVTGGYAFKSTDYSEKGVRVIRISDFNATGLVNNRMVRHRFENFLEMFLIEEKNILLCMTGGTVGKSLMIEKIEEPMMTNQRVATIKINKELLPEFINIVILSPNIQNIIRISKNSTNDNISMDTIKNFPIPVPPLGEQKHIVEKVKGLLSACDMMQ